MKVGNLFKNKYVLYAVLLVAISNVLGYLTIRDYRSVTMFVCVGLLSTYFSKNMIVNLGAAIIFTNLFFANNLLEGLKNKDDKEDDKDKDDKKSKKEGMKKKEEKKGKKEGMEDEKCPDGKCHDKAKKDAFTQNNVPSSSPAPATESEEDEEIGKRIDYAATLEQAYDNLQNVLGTKGMQGLTEETQKLISQQSSLMKTLNTMSPVLQNAKSTLEKFDISKMSAGLGKLTNLISGKK